MKLRIEALTHVYPSVALEKRPIVDMPTWEVPAGAQILLRGISGSGKTTFFNILAGLLHPTTGSVWYGEQSLYALPEETSDRFRAKNIGYVFQNHHLLNALTALENVQMPMAFARLHSAQQRQKRAQELLSLVGLADFMRHRPHQLSTGQRLRVAIARSLANLPRVLLADEPTAALDPEAAQHVMQLMQTMCRDQNAILIVASHDPALEAVFPTIMQLQAGKLVPAVTTGM